MGQTQSSHLPKQKTDGESSALDFGPNKTTGRRVDDPIDVDPNLPEENLRRVTDDGGDGYVPLSFDESPKKSTVPTIFRWEYGGKEIYVSGTFNNWKTRVPLAYSGGEYAAIIDLPSGTHYYKYLVDGNWMHDPNQKTIDDHFGGRNNIIHVNESDFDPTQALLSDECGSHIPQGASTTSLSRLSPPGSYSQLMPEPLVMNAPWKTNTITSPPVLPPHLLNVILNNETVDEQDPTLLPVPNHVALNHLYALSIKDSVMTLSATHRYKKKYFTTILYKPIGAH